MQHRVGARRWLSALVDCIQRTRTFGLAAETAFWLFLSLLPLLAVAGFTAARLLLDNWQGVAPIIKTLPPPAQAFIASELSRLSLWDGKTVGIVGVAGSLWLASSGVHAIFDALESETSTSRRWLIKRALALATCAGLSLSVALLALLGPGTEALLSNLGQRMPDGIRLSQSFITSRTIRAVAGFVILTAQAWCLLRIGIPKRARSNMPMLPGVVVAAVLQMALSIGYTNYLTTVWDASAYTAGLGLVGSILTALYLYVVALLIGVALNLTMGRLGRETQ
ncbi:MAG TPA: YhjD/YihY/BrkB family envelope integrity protein [Polyangiaceae bacterium]|nr:YhjD/YihY/BrkB family envelope integrity protein [Polyangiaceae bacterium]